MPHMTCEQIVALPGEELHAIIRSTNPVGIFAYEYQCAISERDRRMDALRKLPGTRCEKCDDTGEWTLIEDDRETSDYHEHAMWCDCWHADRLRA